MNKELNQDIILKNAVIIQLFNPNAKNYDMQEFLGLAKAANYKIIDTITQRAKKINPKLFIGRGKAEQISEKYINFSRDSQSNKYSKKIEKRSEEDLVFLFNNRLSSNQIVSLSELFKYKVIDRDLLILEIFELNSTNHESKLQIKLARLTLEKALKQREISLKMKAERQGRDFMGKGYGYFEAHKTSYKNQQKKIMEDLMKIRKQRSVQRKSRKRNNIYNISIVGYTNSGKTTLLNTLKNLDLRTKDTAFTTVTTTSRRIGKDLILTDTVGFVYDIPAEIIEAFLSTLEEVVFSDCILLLTDISNTTEQIKQKLRTTFMVLSKIGAINIPIIYAFNKIDKIDGEEYEKKRSFISELLPTSAQIYYLSALDKNSAKNLVNILNLIKNNTLNIQSSKDFGENLIVFQETRILKKDNKSNAAQ